MENIINDNQLEVRYATELRANSETGIISGTAIVFGQESDKLASGQFSERIMPSAATEEFLKTQDIVMKYQHQPDSVLARYRPDGQRNSLHFNVDERGVHFNFKAKQKDAGILEDIQNGDLSACSFSFKVPTEKGAERWEKRSDGTYLRTINKFSKVADFSIVITPAYPQTMVSTRGLDELRQSEELEAQKVREAQEAIDLQKAKDKEALELKSKQDKEAQAAIEAQKAKEKEKAMADYYRAFEDKINKLKK